jgi:hypothetical protein
LIDVHFIVAGFEPVQEKGREVPVVFSDAQVEYQAANFVIGVVFDLKAQSVRS